MYVMMGAIGLLEDVCDDGGYLLCSIGLLEDVCDDGGYLLCSIGLLEDVCDDGGYLLCSFCWKMYVMMGATCSVVCM